MNRQPLKSAAPTLLSIVIAVLSTVAIAQQTPAKLTPISPDDVASYDSVRPEADFVKTVTMIPMRDGTRLYTVVVMKKSVKGGAKNSPILLSRTPYDAKSSTARTRGQLITEILPAMDAEFVNDGYIRVYQDIRGTHNSEGVFVMTRPIVGPLNNTGVDESTDAYDTIDWLVKNVPESNGNVGTIGSSYLGFTTLNTLINPHPALKAAVPQSPMVDTWIGDDDFHNGAFRIPTMDFIVEQSTDKANAGAQIGAGVGDDYSRYLEAGSTGDYAHQWGVDQYPNMQKILQNPAYTEFWSLQAVDKWLAARPLTVPTMLMVGQWDQEDSYGAPAVYKALKPKDKNDNLVTLVIGPWRHSGANHYGYELGALTFNGDTALEFRVNYLKPFLDYHLKGAPDPRTPHVITYATGINRWDTSPKWPMGISTPLYLGQNFSASFKADAATGHNEYVSDPTKPVPFLPRPVNLGDGASWKTWLVHDQRFVSDRPDVLVYKTQALDKPVHIMGAPLVNLFAATSGTDSDWVVKLIDVYPNVSPEGADQGSKPIMAGFELPIGIEIFRGRYVHGFDKPHSLTPGKIEKYEFGLPNVDHVFLPGHKIMIQVQSSLFPLYDRNPQTFVENIFNARPADYKAATESIYFGGAHASSVLLPIVP